MKTLCIGLAIMLAHCLTMLLAVWLGAKIATKNNK